MKREDALRFLNEFVQRIDTQDNRATASPIQFLLQTKRTIWGSELSNPDRVYYYLSDYDYYEYESKEKLIQAMKDSGWTNEEISEISDDIKCAEGQDYWYTEQAFLTEEGLKEHIRLNRHNLGEHRSYVIHSFRNPELKDLYQAIRTVLEKKDNE